MESTEKAVQTERKMNNSMALYLFLIMVIGGSLLMEGLMGLFILAYVSLMFLGLFIIINLMIDGIHL